MASSFRDLEEPKSTSIVEVDGVILSQNDTPPTNFDRKKHAPFIGLKAFSPFYSSRTQYIASVLLARDPPHPRIGPWKLVYYLDYLRIVSVDAYYAAQGLCNTPGDILLRYYLGRGLQTIGPHLPTGVWYGRDNLNALIGAPPPRSWDKKRSGEEKIEHIAFHPSIQVLALSTTFSRIHLFDLSANMFLDYYLCAADSPGDATITTMAFSEANQLAVGLDTGCVDIWTLDITAVSPGPWTLTRSPMKALGQLFTPVRLRVASSGSPFIYRSPQTQAKRRKPEFFSTQASPRAQELLGKEAQGDGKVTIERIELVNGGVAAQQRLVGEVTVVAFSPMGKHLAVGTAVGGVWVYNVTLETSFRVLPAFVVSAVGSRCTALTWGVPPGVRSVPLRSKEGLGARYQLETADTALVVGMESGLVIYLRVRENGAGSITIDSHPVKFYPGVLAGVTVGGGIGQILLVPSSLGVESRQYSPFPTLLVSIRDSPGIHIFRLVPDTVLKASVPSASSVPSTPVKSTSTLKAPPRYRGRMVYTQALRAAGKFFGDYCSADDRVRAIHVGSLDTEYIMFPPTTELSGEAMVEPGAARTAQDSTLPPPRSAGYGGAVKSMAIDSTGRRLVASFSHGEGAGVEESVVWFDASGVTPPASALRALGVVRLERVVDCEEVLGVGEVGFVGGCGSGACAGVVTGGGIGVKIFRGFDSEEEISLV